MNRPDGMGAFEFAVLAGLRAAQLMRGCTPKLTSTHRSTVTAQMEIAQGKVGRAEPSSSLSPSSVESLAEGVGQ